MKIPSMKRQAAKLPTSTPKAQTAPVMHSRTQKQSAQPQSKTSSRVSPDMSNTYGDTWLKRRYAVGMVRLLRLHKTPDRGLITVVLPIRVVIKYGTDVKLSEASTLRFIADTTSVPVPKVYSAFEHKGMNYIMMEHIKGDPIGEYWFRKPLEHQEKLLSQLKGYFEELRRIPHPQPGAVCASNLGPLFDRRIDPEDGAIGPFATKSDFTNFLRKGLSVDQGGELRNVDGSLFEHADQPHLLSEIKRMIEIQDQESPKMCFTHGDANSLNFLVKGDKVLAFIDFEMSGFFPEHWEYTTAMTTGRDGDKFSSYEFKDRFWKQVVGNFLEKFPQELEGEKLRQGIFPGSKNS